MPDWTNMQFQPSMWDNSDVKDEGENTGTILFRQPAHRDIGVSPDVVMILRVHSADYNLDLSTVDISVNGDTAYEEGEFKNEFTGIYKEEFGGFVIGIIPPEELGYDEPSTIKVGLADSDLNQTVDRWYFNTESDPFCYGGNLPINIEKQLSLPLQDFLEVERLRQLLYSLVLKKDAENNKQNKSARVIYQLAYSTELSSILNTHLAKDTQALDSYVCDQRRVVDVAKKLDKKKDIVKAAIQELHNNNVLRREYITTLFDYLDSTLFNYKVSLAANIVLLAKAVEVNG